MSHSLVFLKGCAVGLGTGLGIGFALSSYKGLSCPYSKRFYASTSSCYDPFTASIPSYYTHRFNKPFTVNIYVRVMYSFKEFSQKVIMILPLNSRFIATVRVRSLLNEYGMCCGCLLASQASKQASKQASISSNQWSFYYNNQNVIIDLNNIVITRVQQLLGD